MSKKITLFTLQTFSTTGGIQKMTRTLAHSLYRISKRNSWDFNLWSVYDAKNDLMPQYLPAENFRGFKNSRVRFLLSAFAHATTPNVIILSHINLAVIGLVIGMVNPNCKIWLIAHGIEIWRPLSTLQKRFLKRCDKIICVSHYTKQQVVRRHNVDPVLCDVLNNAVDSFMKLPATFTKPHHLLQRHHLSKANQVVFTLTRLASTEQYKGHDQVIKVISALKSKFPDIKYILAGQYDNKEELRIQKLISDYKVDKEVILTGFLHEGELTDYFLLADLFVLPSKKEGFGIVFIEALACGLPVICGNADGSVDAIQNGELGKAVNTDDLEGLEKAITDYLQVPLDGNQRKYLQEKCLSYFNETNYMNSLDKLISNG